jgi:hypothetical protein
MRKKAFAEVIESSLSGWLAQSWQWDSFPAFGSMVTITTPKKIIFGIVHQIKTGPMDPVRYPFAYQKTEEELLAEQPQIFEFLKTNFSCLTLGFRENNKIHYQLAPEPPKIHAFVEPISAELHKEFFQSPNYLHVLFGLSHQIFNIDELLLAILNNLEKEHILSETAIEQFIETFSLLNGNDYRRLKLFLQRVETIINAY